MIYFDTDLKNYAQKIMFANKNRARKASRGEAQIALRGSTLRFQAAACSRFIDGNGVGHRQLLSRNRRSSPAPGWCRAADPVGRALSRRRALSVAGQGVLLSSSMPVYAPIIARERWIGK